MTRVLVVYSRVGGGHQSAASALVEAFQARPEGPISARMEDVYLQHSLFPLTRFPAMYAWLARGHPRLWAALFHATGWRGDSGLPLVPFMLPGLNRLVEQVRPDVLVSVLPVVNTALGYAAARNGSPLRLEVVLTDWAFIHPAWVGKQVDRYFAPTDQAAGELQRMGVPPHRVETIGIPVRRAFSRPATGVDERERRKAELGFQPQLPLVLVMVGAEGSPSALRYVQALSTLRVPAQFVAVCGRNEGLKQQVTGFNWLTPARILGFTEDIPRLMHACDILVTKAGGVTLAEAFSCAVPTIVNDPLPGQEEGNLRFALLHGAVLSSSTPGDLLQQVSRLIAEPARRASLAKRAATLARPLAADLIVECILCDA